MDPLNLGREQQVKRHPGISKVLSCRERAGKFSTAWGPGESGLELTPDSRGCQVRGRESERERGTILQSCAQNRVWH